MDLRTHLNVNWNSRESCVEPLQLQHERLHHLAYRHDLPSAGFDVDFLKKKNEKNKIKSRTWKVIKVRLKRKL